MNGRMYDPVTARMLSPDNFVQSPFNTQSYNRYSYVFNNPMKFTDPSGEIVWAPIIIGAALGGVSGWQMGQVSGATGWGMAGYIAGGALIGGLSGSAASAVSSAGGGTFISGAVAGALGNGSFSALSGNNIGQILGSSGLGFISGGIGSSLSMGIGGPGGAFVGGAVGAGINTKINGGTWNDAIKSSIISGGISFGTYQLTTSINYSKYKKSGMTFDGRQLTRRQFRGIGADYQRSRFWKAEFGGVLTESGDYVHRYKQSPFTNPNSTTELSWDVENFPADSWGDMHVHHGKSGSFAPNGEIFTDSHSPKDFTTLSGIMGHFDSFVVNRNYSNYYNSSTNLESSFSDYFVRNNYFYSKSIFP